MTGVLKVKRESTGAGGSKSRTVNIDEFNSQSGPTEDTLVQIHGTYSARETVACVPHRFVLQGGVTLLAVHAVHYRRGVLHRV